MGAPWAEGLDESSDTPRTGGERGGDARGDERGGDARGDESPRARRSHERHAQRHQRHARGERSPERGERSRERGERRSVSEQSESSVGAAVHLEPLDSPRRGGGGRRGAKPEALVVAGGGWVCPVGGRGLSRGVGGEGKREEAIKRMGVEQVEP